MPQCQLSRWENSSRAGTSLRCKSATRLMRMAAVSTTTVSSPLWLRLCNLDSAESNAMHACPGGIQARHASTARAHLSSRPFRATGTIRGRLAASSGVPAALDVQMPLPRLSAADALPQVFWPEMLWAPLLDPVQTRFQIDSCYHLKRALPDAQLPPPSPGTSRPVGSTTEGQQLLGLASAQSFSVLPGSLRVALPVRRTDCLRYITLVTLGGDCGRSYSPQSAPPTADAFLPPPCLPAATCNTLLPLPEPITILDQAAAVDQDSTVESLLALATDPPPPPALPRTLPPLLTRQIESPPAGAADAPSSALTPPELLLQAVQECALTCALTSLSTEPGNAATLTACTTSTACRPAPLQLVELPEPMLLDADPCTCPSPGALLLTLAEGLDSVDPVVCHPEITLQRPALAASTVAKVRPFSADLQARLSVFN